MLEEVGARTGVSGLRLDDSGLCGLSYSDDLEVVLECPEGSPVLYLYAPLVSLPDRDAEELFRKILKANFLGLETGGASFAIHDRYNSIMLCHREVIDRMEDNYALEKLLSNFIAMASQWQKKLHQSSEIDSLPSRGDFSVHWDEIAPNAIRI